MNEQMLMVLFGAGASCPVGIPGMAGMAKQFSDDLRKGSKERGGYEALRDYGAGDDLEELLQLANEVTDFDGRELSQFVDAAVAGDGSAESRARLGEYRKRRNRVRERIAAFRSQLLDWITQVCLSFEKPRAVELYGQFLRRMEKRGYPLFTTNYDGVLEYVAAEEGLTVVDNFRRSEGRKLWDETLGSFSESGIRMVKIHGSVYWHADPSGRIEWIDPPAPYNSDGEPVERLIIVPTRFKDIFLRNYFPLYSSFLHSLEKAQVLLVAGHSLRDEYLLAAIRDRLRDSRFSLVVIDPELPARAELEAGARDSQTQIIQIPQPIEDATGLLNQLVDGSSSDAIVALARRASVVVTRNESPKVEISRIKSWLEAGKAHSIQFKIQTTRESVLVEGCIEVGKRDDEVLSLREHLHRSFDGEPLIHGFQEVERSIRLYAKKSLERGPHCLRLLLRDQSGAVIASDERNFRLKGV